MSEHPFMRHEEILKKVRLTTIVFAAAYIALGVCLIMFPNQMQTIMGLVIGLVLLALGGYRLFVYFRRQREASILATDLFIGIVSMLAGLLFVIKRGSVMEFIAVVYGVLLIAGCIIKLQNAIDLKRMGYYRWWVVLLLAALSGALATLMILRPRFINNSFIIIAGLFLLYDGLSAAATVVLFEMNYRKIKKGIPIGRPVPPPPAPGVNPFNPGSSGGAAAQRDADVFQGSGARESEAPGDGAETLHFDPDTGEPLKPEE